MIAVFIAAALLLAIYVLFQCTPRHRTWVAATFALVLGALALMVLDAGGLPKPYWAEARDVSRLRVFAAQYDAPRAIYVWSRRPSDGALVAYRLPWSVALARSLQRHLARGRHTGAEGIILRRDAESRSFTVHDPPPRPSPPKQP